MRVTNHPVLPKISRKQVTITYNGEEVQAVEGESIAAALIANNYRILRHTEKENKPRGIFCGIGHCYDCRIIVNGERNIRACITPVKEGMEVKSEGLDSDEI